MQKNMIGDTNLLQRVQVFKYDTSMQLTLASEIASYMPLSIRCTLEEALSIMLAFIERAGLLFFVPLTLTSV